MNATHRNGAGLLVLFVCVVLFTSYIAYGDPQGAEVTFVNQSERGNASPGTRADPRSTITIINLDSIQKDQHWKAYVGNVTGSLTLDDANNFTIYDWDFASITGEVYASRNGTLDWTSVSCATPGVIINESIFHNMTDTDPDDINSTFNWTIHAQYDVGSTTLSANTCNSTVTYINDSRRVPTGTSPFQEILIMDANGQFAYLTSIESDETGYNNETEGTFDFQLIVAESDVKASPTTYYFYVELG